MNIVVDGLNLSLLQSTGIGTYARELSHLLIQGGHEVSPLFTFEKIGCKAVGWSQVVQRLGGINPGKKIIPKFIRHTTHAFSGKMFPLQAQEILVDPEVQPGVVMHNFPAFKRVFNLPGYHYIPKQWLLTKKYPPAVCFPQQSTVDLVHLTYPFPLKVKDIPTVLTIHDLVPLVLPHSTAENLKKYRALVKTAIAQSTLIFTVSEHSKKDLLKHFSVPEEKVQVTYQSVNIPESFQALSEEDVRPFLHRNFGLKYKEFFLFYGAIEPKKNIKRLLEASTLAKSNYPLVIVGKEGWLCKEIMNYLHLLQERNPERIIRLPYVSFSQLMFLLKGATGLVFPSLYEGFGLPVLEAMQMGCPVITSNTSSLPEIAGNAALLVNPLDVNEIAARMDQLASDQQLTKDLQLKGYEQIKKFNPKEYLKRVEAGYLKALT